MKHIVIVGGGFAGLKVARDLRKVPDIKVTLISDSDEFRYSPALYRTATGGRKRESSIPLSTLVSGNGNTTFIQARIAHLDRKKQILHTYKGKVITYDYCIMALGVVTSYFGIPGLETFSYSIKSAAEVERLKRHLHEQLTKEHATDKSYVIVGAGPTGVELASALGQYLKRIAKMHHVRRNRVVIELIEAAPRVLPTMNESASRIAARQLKKLKVKILVNSKVEGETANTLKVDDRSIATHTVIWTAGVANNPFFQSNADQFKLDKRQRVTVDPFLAVDDHLFVLGDNVSTKYSGLALTAVHQAKFVSKTLKAILGDGSVHPYKQRPPISAVPLGSKRAIVQWKSIAFGGLLGGLLRAVADLIGYADVMGYRAAIKLWLRRDEFEESCLICRAPQVTP
jgi:NADH dehydrogenase